MQSQAMRLQVQKPDEKAHLINDKQAYSINTSPDFPPPRNLRK